MSENPDPKTLTIKAARQLATTTKSSPKMGSITPRWFLKLLPWVSVTAGTYRVNKRKVVRKPDAKLQFSIEDGKIKLEPGQLAQLAPFHGVPEDVLQEMIDMFTQQEFETGAHLIKEGKPGDTFFLIASGKVEINQDGLQGEKLVLGVLGSGDTLGEMALFDDLPDSASVVALIPTTVLTLERKPFLKLVKSSPVLKENIEKAMAEMIDQQSSTNEAGEQVANVRGDYEGVRTITSCFIEYEEEPREFPLSILQAILKIPMRIADIYNDPMNQVDEQMRLMIEEIKERQEWEMLNSPTFGLIAQSAPHMRIQPRKGSPTPDDMDQLLSLVWKKPAFFLAHPAAIAAFGRECTRRGVPPPTMNIAGVPVITWRGIPMLPSNKLEISDGSNGVPAGTTNILLMRVGEKEQGVVGLHQPGIPNERLPSMSVMFNGVSPDAHGNYLLSLYFSCAVLTDDALAVMENVQVRNYYDY